jgi:hypothetical protein
MPNACDPGDRISPSAAIDRELMTMNPISDVLRPEVFSSASAHESKATLSWHESGLGVTGTERHHHHIQNIDTGA